MKIWLFLELFTPNKNFSLIYRRHNYRWKASNSDLWSVPTAIDQWRSLSVPHLLWNGASFYNSHPDDLWHLHLLPSVWQWSCHYLFLELFMSRLIIEHPTFRLRGERSIRLPLDKLKILLHNLFTPFQTKKVLLRFLNKGHSCFHVFGI